MPDSSDYPILCLMGPTASGKTDLALQLAHQIPCEIISVDSAMVYRDMDIGTAKPGQALRQQIPHHLIDICDPCEPYSVGQFCQDAVKAIKEIRQRQRLPLLVGGTMLYFRALQQGLATLPKANDQIRAQINLRAQQSGWPVLHAELQKIDPIAAQKIHANDAQRIQRALEVFELTGIPLTQWHTQSAGYLADEKVINIILAPHDRQHLRERIAARFQQMLEQGFIEEVSRLHQRGDLQADLPAIRAVGYRQAWAYLEKEIDYATMVQQAITATQQLAKRQLTWLRTWPDAIWLDSESPTLFSNFYRYIQISLKQKLD